ncbi:response regulator transcription factor [Paenibacillus periandrae]|uniref:response regulator transcription factor n=1 Tax=Paenibacillus periandrae TaxID=1761741 RepID=UPI001F09FA26|nr:response regulator [Paenibacillus periandrae]
MYQLLIVDDEIHAAHGIENGVDWIRLGFSQVHVAYNIRQAKEVIVNSNIDVIICDIEMPQGSGLELLEWVKERDRYMEVLLLTCHANFEYAQQAIQLGSLEYLLKPARYELLESGIRKAIQKLERERQTLTERFWLELFNQADYMEDEQIEKRLAEYGLLNRIKTLYRPILVALRSSRLDLSARHDELLEYSLLRLAEAAFGLETGHGFVLKYVSGVIVVIVAFDAGTMETACETYIKICKERLECQISCMIGQPVTIGEIRGLVDSLLEEAVGNVSITNVVFRNDGSQLSKKALYAQLPEGKRWLELLQQGAKQALLDEWAVYFNSLKQMSISTAMLNDIYQNYLQVVYYVLQVKGLLAHRICRGSLTAKRATHATRSVSSLQEWVIQMTETAIDYMDSVKESYTVVEKAKQYISGNINKELSREDIASSVYLNPDYLSRLFKKETGLALSEYLLVERFKEAKSLLVTTNMTVSEIASSLGYSNFSHFAKMFRRMARMNPLEYRKVNKS